MNTRSGRIQIRQAQPDDLTVMHAIRRDAILGINSGLDANVRQAWADRRSSDFYAERVAVGDAIIASLADDDVGWGSSTANRITAVYVRSSCSLFGVGRALMSSLEEAIQARGHARATLESSPNALGFYAKLGYAATGVPQADGAVPMARRLRPSE
jgi:putative acetyltransferase